MSRYFGSTRQAPQQQVPEAVRALPASWYTSQAMYELEQQAIFLRKWLLITHKVHFSTPEEYLRYEAASFQFVLGADRSGNVRGFRNTCKDCSSPLLNDLKGTSSMFACGNHGVATETTDTPSYDNLNTIHIHIDLNGFVWVNLDPREVPEIPWEQDFAGIDTQERFAEFDFSQYKFDHEWEMTGDYNWKILSDNYNECYHCATTHPDLKEMADLETYSVTTRDEVILHNVRGRPGSEGEKRFKVHPTYYFPSTSMNISPHFLFMQRFVPHAPVRSTMRYEVYRHKDATEDEFITISDMYKRVMSEDKALCEAAQRNVCAGVFVNGEMHPRAEQGPIFFQAKCRDIVKDYWYRQQGLTATGQSAEQSEERVFNSLQVCRDGLTFTLNLLYSTLRSVLMRNQAPKLDWDISTSRTVMA